MHPIKPFNPKVRNMRKILTVDPQIRMQKIHEFILEPIVIRVNEFDEEAVEQFEDQMDEAHETGQKIIPIIIDSFGGSSYGCQAMVSAVLRAKVPVATIVSGKAMSSGAILFGFGTEGYRYMDKFATIMIHDTWQVSAGKVEEVKADSAHGEHLNNSIYKRLASHLGHKDDGHFLKLIKAHNHADWFLTAQEAKKHKLTNHLHIPEMKIHVGLEMTFK